MTELTPGIYENIPHDVYRGWHAMNYSRLKTLDKSVDEFVYEMQFERKASDAMILGSAVDTLVHEPHLFDDAFAVMPDVNLRTKDGKAARDAFVEAAGGRTVIDSGAHQTAMLIANAVKEHSVSASFLANGKPQVCVVWHDAETRILCKARLDWLMPNRISDLKVVGRGVDADDFARSMIDFGYHIQAALYSDGLAAVTGKHLPFTFVVASSSPPHRVKVYEVEPETLAAGRYCYRRALHTYQACKNSGRWRDTECLETIQLPTWKLRDYGIELPMEQISF